MRRGKRTRPKSAAGGLQWPRRPPHPSGWKQPRGQGGGTSARGARGRLQILKHPAANDARAHAHYMTNLGGLGKGCPSSELSFRTIRDVVLEAAEEGSGRRLYAAPCSSVLYEFRLNIYIDSRCTGPWARPDLCQTFSQFSPLTSRSRTADGSFHAEAAPNHFLCHPFYMEIERDVHVVLR